ncbi:TPA: hypothetical protein DIV48_00175 [Candidatus Kaiserbacteria bacterium]|nr:hypothetical protein [Candidatus Kaiserbacteria bacterium]
MALMACTVALSASTAFVAHAVHNTEGTPRRTVNESVRGQLIAEDHRSTVASFAESLLYIAKKKGATSAVGAHMRRIAEAQIDSMTAATEAIQETASRGAVARLFFGSDPKNLGVLEAEMEKTRRHLAELQTLLASTTDTTERTILTAQIRALEKEQTRIRDFVVVNEKTSGFLGWFTHLLVRNNSDDRPNSS